MLDHRFSQLLGGLIALAVAGVATAADAPSPKLALSFRPVQKDVEIETPSADEYDKCEVKVERTGRVSGWAVFGPNGQMLRRFVDTNADNVVDQWRYFNQGLEVYRDMDTNADNKVDQSRWLNTGGSRWGVDSDQDGRIDRWRILSAEEASRLAVHAFRAGDERLLAPLLFSAEDARTLKLSAPVTKAITGQLAGSGRKLRDAIAAAKTMNAKTEWIRFDGSAPGIIPAEDGKAGADLQVYGNAMAIVETSGKPGLIQLGELVLVGSVWKLTQVPQPIEGESVQVTMSSVLMQPAIASPGSTEVVGTVSAEAQKLLTRLQKLDESAPTPADGRDALAKYNADRAALLVSLVAIAKTDEERDQWTRQMVDGIAAAVQTGTYPDGLAKLQSIEQTAVRERSKLAPYVVYRRLLAEYGVRMQSATNAQRADVQKWWLEQLQAYAEANPKAEDAPDSLLQLAIAEEFAGRIDEAKTWYTKLSTGHGDTPSGERATGALKRLGSIGKLMTLSGAGLNGGSVDVANRRGKITLVVFWATWSQPFVEDLPQLQALEREYGPKGFEIVGVNMDVDAASAKAFVKQRKLGWPQIHEEGGLESDPGRENGIIALPTMFLVDRTGKVVSRSAALDELKTALPELLEK